MPQPIENYIPQHIYSRFRRQAVRVWWIGVAVTAAWVLLIIAAPVFAAYGNKGFSAPLFGFFSYICHQIPERSFFILEHQFGVCSRCFGVYFGLLAGFLAYPLWRQIEDIEPLQRVWLFAALIPIGLDWSLTMFGIWENNHISRFITGGILGVACATFIIPALVEIARNRSSYAPVLKNG